jgi:Ca2+-transporting ATPase
MKPFYQMSVDEVMQSVNSSMSGITPSEADTRLKQNGPNELQEKKKTPWYIKFLAQFKDVMILVLLAAAAVSAIIAIVQGHPSELIDSGIILAIVLLNATIGVVQESKAESAMEALKSLNKPFAKVRRDEVIMKVKSSELVVGDIVLLEAGDIVPADMRLIQCVSLKIEEAALTGEAVPSEKHLDIIDKNPIPLGDRYNMAFSTGMVAYGRGEGVIVATGQNTEVGRIATMLNEEEETVTPLQIQLSKTAKVLSIMVLVIAAVIFAASLLRQNPIMEAFMTAVAIAVAAIPEGLPAVVTIILAIGVQRMSARKAIVRHLPSVEALGCCEVICSDKTGTLTLNQMTVQELFTPTSGTVRTEGSTSDNNLDRLRFGMTLCNDTSMDGERLMGDPTETALVADARRSGHDVLQWKKEYVRKLMSTVHDVDGKPTAFIKGAPDILITKCSFIQEGDIIRPMTESDRESIHAANKAMAKKALRVLALATKHENLELKNLESEMIFVGLVGMIDPPRPEVKDAVATCKKAGMQAIMITGDHVDTASAIASQIGILQKGDLVITGAELDQLSDDEFFKNLSHYRVYARVSPENKVRIVKAFKRAELVVAMTGDGVNDAPSIKAADIGIGMGITGTDVSKEAADVVLADDNFATIIYAVEEGRKIYANIKKVIQFLLSANIAEVLCLFVATVFLDVKFLTPVMILWVNLVTDSLPVIALGMEKAESDVMDQKPRKSGSSLFAGKTGRDIIIQGIMQTILVLVSFSLGNYVFVEGISDHSVAMTMGFVTLIFIQLFHSYNLRSQQNSLFQSNPFANKYLNITFVIGVVLTVVVIGFDFMHAIFETQSIPFHDWVVSIGLAFLIIPMVELQKWIERRFEKPE